MVLWCLIVFYGVCHWLRIPGLGIVVLFQKSNIATDCCGFTQDAAAWVTDQLKTMDTVELVFWT